MLSWPPALHLVSGFMVTVYFLRMVGDFGAKAQAAYSIGLRLAMIGPMVAFPIAGACATLVGQNLGAGNPRRAWRAIGVGLVVHVALLWSVAAVLYGFRVEILSAFSDDPDVVRVGSELLVYQALTFVFFAFYFVFLRSLQGAGDVRVPMLLSLANALLVTIPIGTYLATDWGLGRGPTGVFQASVIGGAVITLATGAWLASGRWARKRLAGGERTRLAAG
jgi:Na+-driven multidrug efflux pump